MKKKRKPFSLYQRNGVWYARAWDEERGEYTSAKTTGETDRDRAAVKASEMVKAGQIVRKGSDPRFIDALREYWQRRDDLSQRYRKNVYACIETAAKYEPFQNLRLTAVKASHINRYIDHLKAVGTRPRTINRISQHIKTFIRWADSRDYIAADFGRKIEKVKENQRRRGFLEPEELFALAAVPWPDARVKAAVMLGAFAGLRRGEIRALQWQDIDFARGMVTVRRNFVGEYDDQGAPIFKTPKAGSERRAPYLVFPELRRALLVVWEQTPFREPGDLVLVNVWERRRKNAANAGAQIPLSETTIKREFTRMLEGIGISREAQRERNIVFHGLRHSFVSLMSSLLPGNVTMMLSGHQTRAMLENYEHTIESAVNDGLEQASRALDKYRERPALN